MSNTPQNRLKQRFKKLLGIAVILYVLITTALYVLQEKLLFLPTVLDEDYQYQFNYNFEELNLKTEDGAILNAIHFKTENPKGVILYFHGNAGDLSRWGTITEFFVAKHYDVLVMDYRSYGKSKGELSESVFYSDAQLFYKYLKEIYDESEITIYGRSLGTGIATYIASNHTPKQLILETPYYSIASVGKHRFPFLPVALLLKYKFPTNKFIKAVACPITIFHGTKDQVIPYENAKKLLSVAPKGNINFVTVTGANHNNILEFEEYHHHIQKILP